MTDRAMTEETAREIIADVGENHRVAAVKLGLGKYTMGDFNKAKGYLLGLSNERQTSELERKRSEALLGALKRLDKRCLKYGTLPKGQVCLDIKKWRGTGPLCHGCNACVVMDAHESGQPPEPEPCKGCGELVEFAKRFIEEDGACYCSQPHPVEKAPCLTCEAVEAIKANESGQPPKPEKEVTYGPSRLIKCGKCGGDYIQGSMCPRCTGREEQ